MPKGLERYYGRGHLHFLTFRCYRRLSLLNTARAHNVFIEALRKIHERYKFSLVKIPAASKSPTRHSPAKAARREGSQRFGAGA